MVSLSTRGHAVALTGNTTTAVVRDDRPRAWRAWLWATGATSVGYGTFVALAFLYYTDIAHIRASTIAAVLTGAGLASVVISVPLGRYLERKDPITVNAVLCLLQAAAVAGVAASGVAAPLAVSAALVTVLTRVRMAARGAVVLRLAADRDRARLQAATKAAVNIGFGAGSGVAAAVCALGTPAAYRAGLVVAAGLYLAGAGLMRRIRLMPKPGGARPAARTSVLRDRRYLLVAVAAGLLSMHYLFLEIGLPEWISQSPGREVWLVSAALCTNTVIVTLVQLLLGSRLRTIGQACAATAVAGVCMLAATVLIALAGCAPTGPACAEVIVAAVIYSVGEGLQSSAGWELSFALAPEDRPVEYQALFTSASTVGTVVAPFAITTVLTGAGDAGWLILGGVVCALGAGHLGFRRYPRASAGTP